MFTVPRLTIEVFSS